MVRNSWAQLLMIAVLLTVDAGRMPLASEAPRTCSLGAYVTALDDLDLEASSFGADLRLWSLCPVGAGGLPPLATADLPNGVHVAAGEIETEDVGGQTYARQRVTGRFWHHWHVVDFPFDQHRLDIVVEDTIADRSRFRFEPDKAGSGLSPAFRVPGWRVSGFEVVEEPHSYSTSFGRPGPEHGATVSRFRASVFLERDDYMGFLKLTASLYAASLMALLAFFSDPGHPSIYDGRMSLIVGALFALILNLHLSDAALGNTPEVTLLAKLHMAGAALILAIALATVWQRRQAERGGATRHPHWPLLLSFLAAHLALNLLLVAQAAAVAPADA